jgi:predicted ABC-type exoprotein transport system permease subunit
MCDTSAKLITVFIRVFTYSEIFKCFDNLLYNILKTLYLEEDCYCSKSYYNFQSMSIVIFMLIQLECALKKN